MVRQLNIVIASAAVCVSAHAQSCTRDSLKAMIADYYRAVETHDISALPLAPGVRVTENGQEIKPGEGLFQTGGKVEFQRSFFDTERCGAVTQAVVNETVDGAQTQSVVAVRLKVSEGKVSEIETIITREAEQKLSYNLYDPKGLIATKDQDWTTPLPPDRRLTREYMNGEANKYFDAFSNTPPAIPAFATPCHRWEGGKHVTLDGDCMPRNLVLTHTRRRFPVTDLELGITAGFINFAGVLPDVHIFKFNKDGKIEYIQAVFGGRQPGPIWPDDER